MSSPEHHGFGGAADAPPAFDYATRVKDPVRPVIPETHRKAWARLAAAGTWWTGAERVAIAAESRAAVYCQLCRERREALSPYAVDGQHDHVTGDVLPPAAVDAVHRLVTDASRLSESYVGGLPDQGLPHTHYVELISVVVAMRSIDAFHRAMGLDPEPLPEPEASGEPSRDRPDGVVLGEAWVPILPSELAKGQGSGMEGIPGPVPYVRRALTLVPDAVDWLIELSGAHYLEMTGGAMMNFEKGAGVLSRAQTELIAGRTSAINECFY